MCAITTFVSAMDKPATHSCNDACYQLVRDRIDQEILGLSKDMWFRGIVGSFTGDVVRGKNPDSVGHLIEIEGKIPQQCREATVYHELYNKHHHVNGVMNNVVSNFVEQLKNVSGTNIAEVHPQRRSIHQDLSPEMHAFILFKATPRYLCAVSDYNSTVPYLTFGAAYEDIHYVQLHGHGINLVEKIELLSGESDASGKTNRYYLRGTKREGGCLFWFLNNGRECDAIPSGCKSWYSCSRGSYIQFGDMLIILGAGGATKGTRGIIEKLCNPEIIVFIKPHLLSCLCQQAFKKSKKDKKGLLALQKFVKKQKVILSGEIIFPKINLQKMIHQELLNFD